jgi:hypothetical protein
MHQVGVAAVLAALSVSGGVEKGVPFALATGHNQKGSGVRKPRRQPSASKTGMDVEEALAPWPEGFDPDDPAVVAAIDLMRWEPLATAG